MSEQKRCIECGGPLPQHAAANSKYCSQDCWKAANKQRQMKKHGGELAQARARVSELEAREASLVEALESIEEIAGDTFTHIPELKDIEVIASAAIAKARGETE